MSLRNPFPAVLAAMCLLLAACSTPPTHSAQVELQIDGKRYDYETRKAQFDDRAGPQGYSVYLLPDDEDGKAPYVALRTYSGNPVTRLWVRHLKPERAAEGIDELDRYQCFVPGVLSDGRQTLGWTKPDGTERHASETGEENCQASVSRVGNELHVTFDAVVKRKQATTKKGKAKGEEESEGPDDTLTIQGKAVVTLAGT